MQESRSPSPRPEHAELQPIIQCPLAPYGFLQPIGRAQHALPAPVEHVFIVIKARLTAFERAQQVYTAAHEKVHAAEANLKAAQTQLGALKADQDQAVDELARALVADGQPRSNLFSAFGPLAPG